KDDWAPDGIVGPHREKEGSFYTLRQVWCPVQISGQPSFDSASVSLPVENRFDFTNLTQCEFEWELAQIPDAEQKLAGHRVVAKGGTRGPGVPPHGSGTLRLEVPDALHGWPAGHLFYVTAKAP